MFLHGSFSLISPASLLQMLCQEQRSVRITAWRGASELVLDLQHGMIVAARCGALIGEEAVFQLAAWETGRFQVERLPDDQAEPELVLEWESLLLEGARRRDELELSLPPLSDEPADMELLGLYTHCPALVGVALVGYDGRLCGAVGIDPALTAGLTVAASCIELIGRALAARPGVMLYVGGGQRLLVADRGDGLVVGLPASGANIGEASSQLAARLNAAVAV